MKLNREIRARASIERRQLTDEEKEQGYIGALHGTVPFNTDSHVMHRRDRPRPFVEQIAPEAFTKSLTEDRDIMANAGHTDDPLAALGRIGENLSVETDEKELRWVALVPDTRAGQDLLNLVDKRIITGTSFEFQVRGSGGQKWEKRDSRTDLRTVTDARLLAFNPIAWPAYEDSSLTVEMRRAEHGAIQPVGDEGRGYYHSCDGIVDYYDPTLTADTKFATHALHRATHALMDAIEYLRAAPEGALTEYARSEVAAAAANAKTLIDWLAQNGTEVNPAAQQRAKEVLKEARSITGQEENKNTTFDTGDRDRRLRLLNLGSH